ncbi:cupin domain-containing protein [Hyphococcus luteus]|uniref:Cupin n=1 Tax=Hyphococcus luteus TaxID=2058213 RepID=A0A2S7K591_9PROT|nr:cupin domain-containing protein [Marinicaulis flavus]PQA87608.1 cupin [Marinicaulis flavus]
MTDMKLESYKAPKGEENAGLKRWERQKTGYEIFMQEEGIPVFRGIGVRDTRELELGDWPRRGARGQFLYLDGLEGSKGMYVMEIPPAKSTEPEKHLYHEFFIVVEGRGTVEIWSDEKTGYRHNFEWQPGSMFRIPPNVNYRLINSTNKRALFIAANNAPGMFNMFRDREFIFNNDHPFPQFFGGKGFYDANEQLVATPYNKRAAIRANFFPDIINCELPLDNQRAPGYRRITPMWHGFENEQTGFVAQYPIGRYSMAHYHESGAVLVCLDGEGYTYNWPREYGFTPWKDGNEDQVRIIEYVNGGLVAAAPGGGQWFHQHFGVGSKPLRLCNFWGGPNAVPNEYLNRETGVSALATTREGGQSIDYRDEDPFVREEFERRLAEAGVASTMPPEIYTHGAPQADPNAS